MDKIQDSGYLHLLNGIWVNEDKDGFNWTLTDFLNLCVSTPRQMRCLADRERERSNNAPVHINFSVALKVVSGRVWWLGGEKEQVTDGGVLKSKGQFAFGVNTRLCNHVAQAHPGLVDRTCKIKSPAPPFRLIIVVTISKCNRYLALQFSSALTHPLRNQGFHSWHITSPTLTSDRKYLDTNPCSYKVRSTRFGTSQQKSFHQTIYQAGRGQFVTSRCPLCLARSIYSPRQGLSAAPKSRKPVQPASRSAITTHICQ